MSANIRHSSENSEFLTPQWLTDWAHLVMGGIDLDPASSAEANRTVRASHFYTKESNGLFAEWRYGNTASRVWLNAPGGLVDEAGCEVIRKSKTRPGCTESGACGLPPGHTHEGVTSSAVMWWHKLVHEFEADHVACAVFLGFSLELLQSAQGFAGKQPLDFPCCVPKQRLRFETEVGGMRKQANAPTHGNVIVLVTTPSQNLVERFARTFEQIGYVHVPRGF